MSMNAFENLLIYLEPHPVFAKTQTGGEGSFGEFMKILILRHAFNYRKIYSVLKKISKKIGKIKISYYTTFKRFNIILLSCCRMNNRLVKIFFIFISSGRPMVPVQKQLLLFLWDSASRENFERLADRFGVHQVTAIRVAEKVITAIIENLLPEVIKWPTAREQEDVKKGFNIRGLKKVIGAIDGTHIKIKAPSKDGHQYVNRKGFHSVIIQGICDFQMKFLDCYI